MNNYHVKIIFLSSLLAFTDSTPPGQFYLICMNVPVQLNIVIATHFHDINSLNKQY